MVPLRLITTAMGLLYSVRAVGLTTARKSGARASNHGERRRKRAHARAAGLCTARLCTTPAVSTVAARDARVRVCACMRERVHSVCRGHHLSRGRLLRTGSTRLVARPRLYATSTASQPRGRSRRALLIGPLSAAAFQLRLRRVSNRYPRLRCGGRRFPCPRLRRPPVAAGPRTQGELVAALGTSSLWRMADLARADFAHRKVRPALSRHPVTVGTHILSPSLDSPRLLACAALIIYRQIEISRPWAARLGPLHVRAHPSVVRATAVVAAGSSCPRLSPSLRRCSRASRTS